MAVVAAVAERTTRSGVRLHIRTAQADDEQLLAGFYRHVAPEDLRYRFLIGLSEVPNTLLRTMLSVDHQQAETFLAFDAEREELVAVAMLAGDPQRATAEVAINVRADCKHKGIAWTLLDYVAHHAADLGFTALISIESRDNREAIQLEREMGFSIEPYPDDLTLVMVRRELAPPAATS